VVELAGHAGFDYVEFAGEYAPYDLFALENLGRAVNTFDHMSAMFKVSSSRGPISRCGRSARHPERFRRSAHARGRARMRAERARRDPEAGGSTGSVCGATWAT
jgi:hypothetical protein